MGGRGFGGPGGPGGGPPPNPILEALDTDGDQMLSEKEIQSAFNSSEAILMMMGSVTRQLDYRPDRCLILSLVCFNGRPVFPTPANMLLRSVPTTVHYKQNNQLSSRYRTRMLHRCSSM